MDTILIPTDGSLRSIKACKFALKNFSERDYKIEIYHIMTPGGIKEEGEAFIKNAREVLSKGKFIEINSKIVETLTDIGDSIINEAKEINAKIIIMSRFGANRSEHTSVSQEVQKVVNLAPTVVIIVK